MIDIFIVVVWVLISLLLFFMLFEILFPLYKNKKIKNASAHPELTKKEKVSYFLNLGGFLIAVFAIQISLYTIKESNEDRVEQEKRYYEQRIKDSINQVVMGKSKDFLEGMNTSFDKLNTNVNNITGKMESIPGQIDNISGSFQSLNDVSQKQYSVIFDQYTSAQNELREQKEEKLRELSKRPLIVVKGIECAENYATTYFNIDNDGELAGIISKIIFIIPERVKSESFAIENVPSTTIIKNGQVIITSENIGEFKARTPYHLRLSWQFFNSDPEGFDVNYKVFYWNRTTPDSTIGFFKICNLTHQ